MKIVNPLFVTLHDQRARYCFAFSSLRPTFPTSLISLILSDFQCSRIRLTVRDPSQGTRCSANLDARLIFIRKGTTSQLWNELIERYHYLGHKPLAEVAVPRTLLREILYLIRRLHFFDNTCEAGMMSGIAEERFPEWGAMLVVCQSSKKKWVLDASAWLFWCFYGTAC